MRILYVAVDTPVPGTHGGSVHALELCRALGRRRHEVHLLAPRGGSARETPALEEPILASLASDGVHVHRLTRPTRFLEWTAGTRVKELAAELAPDVVVDRFYTFGGAGIWAAHALGLPAVLEVNSPARPYPGSWRDRLDRLSLVRPIDRWRWRLLRWSDAIYATSKHLVPPEWQATVTVITNGVDTERFCPGPAREQAGPLRCVYVSSFRSWHGAEDLVEAVRLCSLKGVPLSVACLGQGPRWEAARSAAERSGLLGTMIFLGEVPFEEVPGHLAAADVGLAPFSPEAFSALQLGWFWSPIKIFEYLASGLGIVTVDIPELRDLLPESVARFYAPGRPDDLARHLEHLASHRAALQEARRSARLLAETRYTWAHQASVVEGVLNAVVARRRPARGLVP